MTDSKECKIIDTIENIQNSISIIETPCGKFLIGIEKYSIYKYCLETRQKFRIAGSIDQPGYQDGTRDESRFNWLKSLTLSKDLKTLFVADFGNGVIRAICVDTGVTTTFAGQVRKRVIVDGPKEKAGFICPRKLKLSPDGNTLMVSDYKKLRTVCITTGQVDTIHTFINEMDDFVLSPDRKHIYILNCNQCLKYNFKTNKSEILFKGKGLTGYEFSKYGQLLFVASWVNQHIKVVNIVTNEVINTIPTPFNAHKITISTNGKQLYINDNVNIQVLDISKHCTNFKTFTQLQLFKHSFLPRQVIRFN
jgi:DNA-binding beta-propeller fold protein YncE